MNVLGINAVFHDPAAALLVDGETVAAAEEERFSRRKHGKDPVPFSTWELPTQAARWCLDHAGLTPADVDAVAYSYDPTDAPMPPGDLTADGWEALRTLFAARAPSFLRTALPGLDPARVRFVPHHVAHAASAWLAAPHEASAVLVADGRGERTSLLTGRATPAGLEILDRLALPDSLGLVYESLTEHLGFHRGTDEYKVMALASYGEPRWLPELRDVLAGRGAPSEIVARAVDWTAFTRRRRPDDPGWSRDHADLACSVQARLEELLLSLARSLRERTGEPVLTMAGGVALNCVANRRLWREAGFRDIWVQPAAGDAGTALGAAMAVAHELGDAVRPMPGAALGRRVGEAEARGALEAAEWVYEEPDDVTEVAADVLASDGLVAWVQGAAEFGPRALGHRSLLADPRSLVNLERLNVVKGREQFRPVAPMVLASRAAEIFEDGPLPSPYMLFTHRVRDAWRDRIAAAVHVDGTARVQTVDERDEPLLARLLTAFEERTGVPVLVNTSLNTAGRPIVDTARDALEVFGSAPIDLLVLDRLALRRGAAAQTSGGGPEVVAGVTTAGGAA